jgi:hypothetical protein
MWLNPPDPSLDPLAINYDSDMKRVAANSPMVSNSTEISAFVTELSFVRRQFCRN